MNWPKIDYGGMNARQKEARNYHTIAALLAERGFECVRVNPDWQGADFLAWQIDSGKVLKVQLKSRATIAHKYMKRDLWLAFPVSDLWIVIYHDELLNLATVHTNAVNTSSWENGEYSWPRLSGSFLDAVSAHRI